MDIVAGIIALLKAIPTLDSWMKQLVSAYTQWKLDAHDREFTNALQKLIAEGDQRDLEEAAGMDPGPNPDSSEIITRPRRPR